jgi:phenylacetate-coenzyme A ligase PaaK-like adenylate-forming protein
MPGDKTTNDAEKSLAELERGLGSTPAYRRWRPLDPGPGAAVDERYAALPATTKASMRSETFRRFVPDGADLDAALESEDAEIVFTSGTNDVPTPLVWSQDWWDASDRASRPLNTHAARVATGAHREAVLASPLCVGPDEHDRPLPMDERTYETWLFLNQDPDVARWTDDTVRRMNDELAAFDPVILEADPWYLAAFCAHAERIGLRVFAPQLVVFTYALPSKLHLLHVARAMPVPMASSYGSTETGYVFFSCEQGRLHQCVRSCRVDTVALRPEVGDPLVVKPLLTPFGHPWMCLLRFDVGDLVRLASEACPCGRTGGVLLDRIEGRVDDVTLRTDGRLVSAAALDDAIASASSAERIVSYQLDQTAPRDYLLRVACTGPIETAAIGRALRDLYGSAARTGVETVDALRPEASGKYLRARMGFEVDPAAWFEPGRAF